MPKPKIPEVVLAFDLVNPRAQSYLELHALEMCKTIEEGLKESCQVAINEGFRLGESAFDIRQRVLAEVEGYPKWKAMRVARTETINASRQGTIEGYIQSGIVERARWLAAPTSCEECQALNGQEFDLSEVPDSPHPNCLLPGNKILPMGLIAMSRAFYTGQAIELTTENGNRLAVTPNHMVLTPSGFVRTKALHEGNYIIASTDSQGIVSRVNPDNNDIPTFVEDIWDSLMMQNDMVFCNVPITSEDFYGDARGFYGNVNIIRPNSSLLNDIGNSSLPKHINKNILCDRNPQAFDFPCFSPLLSFGDRMTPTPAGFICSSSQDLPLFWGQFTHTNNIGLATITRDNPNFEQASANNRPAYTELSRQFQFRFASLVAPEQIIKVRYFQFCGHVYDLQSLQQLYISNNIIVKNCRCSTTAVLRK